MARQYSISVTIVFFIATNVISEECMNRSRFLVGSDIFKEYKDSGIHMIDKTSFIEEFLTDQAVAIAITKPRRFGKSTNLNMLKTYLEIEVDEKGNKVEEPKNTKYFSNTYINGKKNLADRYQGKFPVIYLRFKDVGGDNFEKIYNGIRIAVANTFNEHFYLEFSKKLTNRNKVDFLNYCDESYILNEGRLGNSLNNLAIYLRRHFNSEVFFLVDEFDVPIQKAMMNLKDKKETENIINIIKSILSSLLKSNENVKKGCVVGFMKWSRAEFFTGLNNVVLYNIFKKKYSDKFGFTENEVKEFLKAIGEPDDLINNIKDWYNGYNYGGYTLYNPYSVMMYLYEKPKQLELYWESSGNPQLLETLFKSCAAIVSSDILLMLEDKDVTIQKFVEKDVNLDHIMKAIYLNTDIINTANIFYVYALHGGYINIKGFTSKGNYYLKIPNEELKIYFNGLVKGWIKDIANLTDIGAIGVQILEGLDENKDKKIQEAFKSFLTPLVSNLPKFRNKKLVLNMEKFYHLVLDVLVENALRCGYGHYDTYCEIEVARNLVKKDKKSKERLSNRADYIIIDKLNKKMHLIELKIAASEKEMIKKYENLVSDTGNNTIRYQIELYLVFPFGYKKTTISTIQAVAIIFFNADLRIWRNNYARKDAKEISEKVYGEIYDLGF